MTTIARADLAASGFTGRILDGRAEIVSHLDDLAHARVALIGDPVELTRLVAPLARHAAHLKVFQREGVWVLPALPPLRTVPGAGVVSRAVPRRLRRKATEGLARLHLHRHVADPWTRRQLTPQQAPTRGTVVGDHGYHRALRRPHVTLVTWPITGIVAIGIRTADGLEHHVDVIARA